MKLIFLDRDGVINKDLNTYVTRPEDFEFLPGVLKALHKLSRADYEIIIVSNQAGVAKGIFKEDDLNKVNEYMLQKIEEADALIADTLYCIHSDDEDCDCRKPKTGLFDKALKERNINPHETYLIGDKESDITAAHKKGLKSIIVLSGKTKQSDIGGWKEKPDYIKKDLKEAVDFILEKDFNKDKQQEVKKNKKQEKKS
jgi:histidinol-phosphate phosphatase family protein